MFWATASSNKVLPSDCDKDGQPEVLYVVGCRSLMLSPGHTFFEPAVVMQKTRLAADISIRSVCSVIIFNDAKLSWGLFTPLPAIAVRFKLENETRSPLDFACSLFVLGWFILFSLIPDFSNLTIVARQHGRWDNSRLCTESDCWLLVHCEQTWILGQHLLLFYAAL